jgi:hypothetical protein
MRRQMWNPGRLFSLFKHGHCIVTKGKSFDPNDPRYDQSGRFPIDETGLQVVTTDYILFPGGPIGYLAVMPEATYLFGISYRPYQGSFDVLQVYVSSLGFPSDAAGKYFDRFKTEADYSAAKERLAKYLMQFQYSKIIVDLPMAEVVFLDGDLPSAL